ncbi:MAG TPA: ROK family transcriptional regulator [Kofleriaceae bacterium]|nr:ROK family transcriptional regulator [Kofleriaceae bacterium]
MPSPVSGEDSGLKGPLSAGHILQMIREAETSRAEIARATGLARSTVSQRVEALLDLGLVVEEGDARSTGGRPATRLRLNKNGGVVLAADLGANHDRLAVADLAGNILAEQTAQRAIAEGPAAILDWVRDNFLAQLDRLGLARGDVIGVGIGVPGPVEFAAGRAVKPPIMPGWHEVSIPDHFTGALPGVEVLVDNDVNIMAVGEYRTYWRHTVSDMIYVKVATGIGAGIISGGQLQRGAQGAAGDIGHIRASEYLDLVCACGNAGCIEAVASGSALARRLSELGHDSVTSMDVVALVQNGNADAVRLVREAGRLLGEVLAHAVNLLNPSVLVIGGDLAKAQQELFAGIREVIYRRSSTLATGHLEIMRTRLGDRSGVIGAAALVLDRRLSPEAVDRQVALRSAA